MRLDLYITSVKEDQAINQDLIFRANALNVFTLYFYDEEDSLVDITGATIHLVFQSKVDLASGESAELEKILEPDDLTQPTAGETEVELTAADVATLLGNYFYQIVIVLPTDKKYVVAEGTACFKKSLEITES